jgi:hypothetical protein
VQLALGLLLLGLRAQGQQLLGEEVEEALQLRVRELQLRVQL